jgi:hypothetical protein
MLTIPLGQLVHNPDFIGLIEQLVLEPCRQLVHPSLHP